MFTIYIEKDIYDEICLFDEFPTWKKVLASDSYVCMNIDKDSLDKEILDTESPLFLLFHAYPNAKEPIPLKEYFDQLYEDLSNALDHPNSSFLLNISDDEAKNGRNHFGVAIFNKSDLSDDYFNLNYFKEVKKDEIFKEGWGDLISGELPVSNSLVISDGYLFENDTYGRNFGLANLPDLLAVILPKSLGIEFHLTIIAEDGGKSRDWWVREYGKLKTEIRNLRSYDIRLELVLTKTIHKRKIIGNYINGWADKGFSFFHCNNKTKIRGDNDINIYAIFNNIDSCGDNHIVSIQNGLNDLKQICENVSNYIIKNGECSNYMLFGGLKNDKMVANRLLI